MTIRNPALELCAVSATAEGQDLLVDIDLRIEPGQHVAVLGPSGAGKSSLLRCIAGLLPVSSGSVRLDGHDVTHHRPHQRGIGLMFQDGLLFPHLDVAGNVSFGPRMRGGHSADQTRELLDLVGLHGFGSRRVSTLSGGEQQRVALARALATRPSVLMLDEPFSALDVLLTRRLLADVRALADRLGMTVVAVTHDPGEAAAIAEQWVVMDEGRILQIGSRAELSDRPASPLVSALAGSSPA